MEGEIFDTHAHLDFPDLASELQSMIERAKGAGVNRILTIGSGRRGLESAYAAVEIANNSLNVWASIGVHPEYATEPKNFIDDLNQLVSKPRVVAIGETGLDFSEGAPSKEIQYDSFKAQIDLSQSSKKPLIIHSRHATKECVDFLKHHYLQENYGGVFHCFVEDFVAARSVLDLGFFISFTGIISFKNAASIRECAQKVPLNRIMVETDCPFLAPVPFRGKRNEPSYVVEVVKVLSDLKKISYLEMAQVTTDNARDLFKL